MSRGGYRKGSGRSKSGYYKGIYCGSTYELCWAIYSLNHGIKFSRFDSTLSNGSLRYIPDFILDDGKTIIEIKGYEKEESVDKKTKMAESFGYEVIVLRKVDLRNIFDYVTKTYGTKKFYELYDDYKPKYQYTCFQCNLSFKKEEKLKTEKVFCSRKCAGQSRSKLNKNNPISEKQKLGLLKRWKSTSRSSNGQEA